MAMSPEPAPSARRADVMQADPKVIVALDFADPAQAMALVDRHVQGLGGGHARLLTLGLVVTLYTASRGVE